MATATEIIEKVRHALENRNYKEFAACFHEEGIYERPYALKGTARQYDGAKKFMITLSQKWRQQISCFK